VSTLQSAQIEVYLPPTIHYARDGGGDTELFAIPSRSPTRSATVLSMELEVKNLKTNATKRYYSAFLGEHPREATALSRQFAPLSIAGRAVFTETVRIYPAGDVLPKLVDDKGEYGFRLQLNMAAPSQPSFLDWLQGRVQPAAVAFQMTLPWTSDQQLGTRRGTIAMHPKDWKATGGPGRQRIAASGLLGPRPPPYGHVLIVAASSSASAPLRPSSVRLWLPPPCSADGGTAARTSSRSIRARALRTPP
jgi:hypothetical protein